MFDTIYDDARRRICAIAADLSPEQLDATVPATPEWTARQVVAHLTGVASDSVHGRSEGAPGPEWTAPQVARREGRSLDEVVAEWAQVAPDVREGIAQRRIPVQIVHDALTHEADLREAFGLGALPAEVVDVALPNVAKPIVARVARGGTLVVRAGEHEWRSDEGGRRSGGCERRSGGRERRSDEGERRSDEGDKGETTVLIVEPYELYRGLISRRSRAQMRAWDWSGDTERYVDALPVFGARDDDQPIA